MRRVDAADVTAEVLVVGGGLIGLACAWRAAAAGRSVAVFDEALGSGASHVAAGMLAPVAEVAYGEEDLLALTIASARRWPTFAAELERATGLDVGYRQRGTLLVGFDRDDVEALGELHRFQRELGLDTERLRSRECRQREPLLSPRVRGGVLARDDHQVEPRRVQAALETAAGAAAVVHVPERVDGVDHDGRRITGLRLASGRQVRGEQVVLAAGCWSGEIGGLPLQLRVPVRPVKGQLLVLRSPDGEHGLSMTVRGLVRSRSVYLVPRGDGRVVVGATQEERGHDTMVTAGGVRTLLDDAAALVPGVDEFELTETLAGLRPGTPDNRPLIGSCDLDGLVLATGHHRHGVLLAPATADAVAAILTGRRPDAVVDVAHPRRLGSSVGPTVGAGARRGGRG
jgi:glycine oxidase